MENNLTLSLYRDQLLSLRCQRNSSGLVLAKPLLILAVFSVIKRGAKVNRISIADLKEEYTMLQHEYDIPTPFQYPLYFMESEPFFHLSWKGEKIITKSAFKQNGF
jgi:hypothetical protein